LDGMPEIAIALSENRIPIINYRGDEYSIETDGWVWWVKCTHATGPDDATLVAIQHNSGPRDTSGKLLGIRESKLLWEHHLPRAGSGFEELDRIVIDRSRDTIVFGVACDNVVSCLTLKGEQVWSTRISTDAQLRSVMHVRTFRYGRSVVVTSGGQNTGIIAELDTLNGEIRNIVKLPFRGAQIELLDLTGQRLIVASADTAQVAIVDWQSGKLISVLDLPSAGIRPKLAANLERGAIVIGGMSDLCCYDLTNIYSGLLKVMWQTSEVHGYINRLFWVDVAKGTRLLASTCGSAARPRQNGIYLIQPTGKIDQAHYLSSSSEVGIGRGLAGVRDLKIASLTSPNAIVIVAVADDSHLYVWNPT